MRAELIVDNFAGGGGASTGIGAWDADSTLRAPGVGAALVARGEGT